MRIRWSGLPGGAGRRAAVAAAFVLGVSGCGGARPLPVTDLPAPVVEDIPVEFRPAPASAAIGESLVDLETRLVGYDLIERFALTTPSGRIDYLALNAGGELRNPALLFENGKLIAIVDERARRVFAACRTQASTRGQHWMHGGFERYRPMLLGGTRLGVQIAPLQDETPMQALVVDTTLRGLSLVQDATSLIPSGLSVGTLPKSVGSMYKSAKERTQAQTRFDTLRRFPLGTEEVAFVEQIGVDWARVEGGSPLLWYRSERFEVLIRDGRVVGVEYPARYERTQGGAGSYYEPGVDWRRCPG